VRRSSDLQFVLASPANEAQLRRLLRDNPLSGDIRVSLEREPNAFHAAAISGDQYQLILAYVQDRQRLIGAGARFELDAYVNGEKQRIGYLGELRVDGGLKQRRTLLLEAYRALRGYHNVGTAPFYLTTIIADNTSTRRLLEAGLSDMPTYRPLETMVTLTIPAKPAARRRRSSRHVEAATDGQLADIAGLLSANGRHFQFNPVWREEDLRSGDRCRDLAPQDFCTCRVGDQLTGCLALWDQRSFKQTVIRDYIRRLARVRPIFNAVAPIFGRPSLPAPGASLQSAFLSHVAVGQDDPETLIALVQQACRHALQRGLDYVMIAFAERNPLTSVIRKKFSCHRYVSMVYVVYWEDGTDHVSRLDGRIPHPEMAIL
jgi:hypothetical protein